MKAPNVSIDGVGVAAVAVVALAVGVGFYVWINRRAIGEAASDAVALVNPADADNLVNRGVSAIGEAVTGREGWSLGSQIADWFPSQAEREFNESMRPAAAPAPPPQAHPMTDAAPYGLPDYFAP
jgi:hypothetical protein